MCVPDSKILTENTAKMNQVKYRPWFWEPFMIQTGFDQQNII